MLREPFQIIKVAKLGNSVEQGVGKGAGVWGGLNPVPLISVGGKAGCIFRMRKDFLKIPKILKFPL